MTHRAKTNENQVYVMGCYIDSELAATHQKHNTRKTSTKKKGRGGAPLSPDKDAAGSVLRQQSLMFLLQEHMY